MISVLHLLWVVPLAVLVGCMLGQMNFKDNVSTVEVVRCKDCRYSFLNNEDECCCDNPDGLLGKDKPNDFCSYGERKVDV